jgi:hypothetical protein
MSFIENIDWEQLKKQKATLTKVVFNTQDGEVWDDLEGLLNLIDAIQDYAVDELGVEENVVFDLTEENGL